MVKRSRKKAFSSCRESCHECTKFSTFIIKTQSFVKSFTFFSTTLLDIAEVTPYRVLITAVGKGWIVCQIILFEISINPSMLNRRLRVRFEEQKRHENSIFWYTHERRENWYFLSTSDHTAVLRMTASLWQLECVYLTWKRSISSDIKKKKIWILTRTNVLTHIRENISNILDVHAKYVDVERQQEHSRGGRVVHERASGGGEKLVQLKSQRQEKQNCWHSWINNFVLSFEKVAARFYWEIFPQ